jgi:dienelactone hydrolase
VQKKFFTVQLGIQLFCCIVLFLIACQAWAEGPAPNDPRFPTTPPNEEVLKLPGDSSRPVTLQVTLFTPSGPGPFPLAVMNHGATEASANNRGERYRFTVSAYYFLSRGYAVALPMMRGFAESGGELPHAGCNLATIAQSNANDIVAVIEALKRRPEIDGSRIVVAGQSFGAWNTLGLGMWPPAGVKGLISFNAAIRSSDCRDQDRSMITAAGQMGSRTALPSLWFYGDNDKVMPTGTWRAVYDSYTKAGGQAKLVDFGPYKDDSHQLLSSPESLPLWAPEVDAFLGQLGLPAKVVHPEYLPHPAPPATHFAALADAQALPVQTDNSRALYQKFLAAKEPRAFVIGANGSVSEASTGYDPLGRILLACSRAGVECYPYAVDDDVVWTGKAIGRATNEPGVKTVTKTVALNTESKLGTFLAVNPDCTSKGLPTVSIANPPANGAAKISRQDEHPNFPATHPFVACNATAVPAIVVTYSPNSGFSGPDTVTIDDLDTSGKHQVIRFDITVK